MTATDLALERGLAIVRAAFLDWLIPAAPDGRAQWGMGGKDVMPFILIQPTLPGAPKRYIGMPAGWRGEIAVRARAKTMDEAQMFFTEVANAIPAAANLTDETYTPGWVVQVLSIRPIIGFTGGPGTVGAVYRVWLTPKEAA